MLQGEPAFKPVTIGTMPENKEQPCPRVSQRTTKGIAPKRFCLRAEAKNIQEPASWEDVLQLPLREKNKWIQAAQEEIQSMEQHKVWQLVDLPAGKKAITVKWVFKVKLDAQG